MDNQQIGFIKRVIDSKLLTKEEENIIYDICKRAYNKHVNIAFETTEQNTEIRYTYTPPHFGDLTTHT